MIYFYEFLRGAGLGLMLFAGFYFHKLTLFYLALALLPGLFLFIIAFLLIKNEELYKRLERTKLVPKPKIPSF